MDSKIEVGQENIYFEMESKQKDDAGTYDDIIPRNDPPHAKPNVEAQPCKDFATVKHHRLFFIASAIAVASLLTALATLVLAVAVMASRSEVSTDTSQLEKKVQELERRLSAVEKNSHKPISYR
ncbi:uncharacterized protein LOC111345444 isoform X2 [Stylophora pistillata]|uniref:uncharacterized protein LOC111345444 isoform X2 n=1 Tax=Stylophora pistillata TaxID=50429 RepID=UPI000C0536BF|nr:uncharacterized protein LOC111345444 isoform X2 [Stylophora pistillata]